MDSIKAVQILKHYKEQAQDRGHTETAEAFKIAIAAIESDSGSVEAEKYRQEIRAIKSGIMRVLGA